MFIYIESACIYTCIIVSFSQRDYTIDYRFPIAFFSGLGTFQQLKSHKMFDIMTLNSRTSSFLFTNTGVALSILDDQTSSLVGVAISASLLPPAVNCGMLLIVAGLKGENFSDFSMAYQPRNPELFDNLLQVMDDYFPNFSQMGFISLMLTVINVIMVACGSALMFRVKEVLPIKKKVSCLSRHAYQHREWQV